MTAKVNILMSTYNGELYIRQQLDSIFSQTYKNFQLYVRDDASNDRTLEVIESYRENLSKEQADKFVIIPNPAKQNWGYMKSFWWLLKNSPKADYYAFCDQDDVWLPDKIERGVMKMNQERENIPLLYTARFDYYSSNMEFQEHGIEYPYDISFDKVAFYTPAFGFTIMINDCLKKTAFASKDLTNIPHDAWCLKIAAAFGKIIYDNKITAKYRRHGSTVTYATASKWKLVKEWIRNDILKGNLEERYWFLDRFEEEYYNRLLDEDRKFIQLFGADKILKGRMKKVFYKHRLRPTLGGEIALRICFLLGK